MSYQDLWSVLTVWRHEFTVKEFTSTFASPDPNKVLHDMAKKGFIESTGWGRYRVNSQSEYVRSRTNIAKAYELVMEAGWKYALIDSDAVFFWTKGGYTVGKFFGFYPIHIAVYSRELREWKRFLRARGQRFVVDGEPLHETLFGLFYVLHPAERIKAVKAEGCSVMPLKATAEFCRKQIFAYQPALEMLDKMYRLGLGVKYREDRTSV